MEEAKEWMRENASQYVNEGPRALAIDTTARFNLWHLALPPGNHHIPMELSDLAEQLI